MKHTILIPLSVLVLASLACGLFNKTDEPASLPTGTAVAAVQVEDTAAVPTSRPEPEALPTNTQEEPTLPPEPTATEAPTETPPGPYEYTDAFDSDSGYWSEDLVVTTQTYGRDLFSKGIIQDGMLSFNFNDKETYIYKFLVDAVAGNVSIEADYPSIGHLNNGIALVCKVNEERTSWFEARVSSTSDYSFFLYDQRRKTEEGKNPYLLLGKGKFKIEELYPTKPNRIKLTCQDTEMVLDTNDGMRVISQVLETQLPGRGVGLGVMSYDVIPITINFDQITIREEQ